MRRSPAATSASRSASSATSSAFPPSCPAKVSRVARKPPFTRLGPAPPGTAAPRSAARSAWKLPPRNPASAGRKGASGSRTIGATLSTTSSGTGSSEAGNGAALTRSSRFCFCASTAARTTSSSGLPVSRSFTSTSRSSTYSSFAPGTVRSRNAMRAFSTAARSTRSTRKRGLLRRLRRALGRLLGLRLCEPLAHPLHVRRAVGELHHVEAQALDDRLADVDLLAAGPDGAEEVGLHLGAAELGERQRLTLARADRHVGHADAEAAPELGRDAPDLDRAAELRGRASSACFRACESRIRSSAKSRPATRTTRTRTVAARIFGQRRCGRGSVMRGG